MKINSNYIDKRGNVYEGVTERALKKEELLDLGKFVHQTERNGLIFGKENGVYIYQDIDVSNIAYRIYDEFADYGFNGYGDEKLIYNFNKVRENIKLTDLPIGIITCEGNIIGQIIYYYENSDTFLKYVQKNNNINVLKFYKQILNILKELYFNGIIYMDVHPKNFVVYNNSIKLIDFDKALIDFDNGKSSYGNMIFYFNSMMNYINSILKMDYKVKVSDIRDFKDTDDVIKEMEKKLIK